MTKKKSLILSIVIIFVGLIITGASYAFWSFTSNNKSIVFNTASNLRKYINYSDGGGIFSGTLQVGEDYTDGIHTTISVSKSNEANRITLTGTIYMDVNAIGNNMKNSSALKWAVTSGSSSPVGTLLAEGNFMGASAGDTLTLYPSFEVTTTPQSYTIWIWLDEAEHPSEALSGETLDTNVWAQIDQVEGVDEQFTVTQINANYQTITATAVNNMHTINGYKVTTSSSEPSEWEPITSPSQIYNLPAYSNTQVGETYYVWFKDTEGHTTNDHITISASDTTPPSCTWGTFNPSSIGNGETATISLTCTDSGSGIVNSNITTSNITASNSKISISNISKESTTNGYIYTVTVTGISDVDGTDTLTLAADIVKDGVKNGNVSSPSGNITIANRRTITINAGNGISSISGNGFTYDNTTNKATGEFVNGTVIDLSTLTITYKTGYSGTSYTKTSGEGTLSGTTFTVGSGAGIVTIDATTLATPLCTLGLASSVHIYNQSDTIVQANKNNAYDSGVTKTYEFGYTSSSTGILGNFESPNVNSSFYYAYGVSKTLYRGTRYYGVRVTVTGDGGLTATCTTPSGSYEEVTFVNARIDFDAATNEGTLLGTSPLYVSYDASSIYTGRTNATAGTIPIASKTGYTFNGWYTDASGGTKVINADGTLVASVSNWTNENGNWILINDSDAVNTNRLYAQYTINTYTITINAGNGMSMVAASGWTNTGTNQMTKALSFGDSIDLSTLVTATNKTGYTGTAWEKTSGEGTLSGTTFTVGAGISTLTVNATAINAPTCQLQANTTARVYNYATIVLTANDVSSAYDSDATIQYSFGYASNTSNALGNYSAWQAGNTFTVAKNAYRGTRYYGVKVQVTGDGGLTNSCESGTGGTTTSKMDANRVRALIRHAYINFNVATNGGTLNGAALLYARYGSSPLYTTNTGDTTTTAPTATKTGYTFNGWYSAATGGTLIIDTSGTVQKTAVSGWINTSGNWVITATSTTSKVLYAQFSPNTYAITLDNQGATSAGTSTIYQKYDNGVCLDSSCSTVMTTSTNNITIPTKTGYTFQGYYDGNTQMIDSNGYITADFTNTKYTEDKTLTASWADTTPPTMNVSVTDGSTYLKSNTATITIADNLELAAGTYTIKYGWSTTAKTCNQLTDTTTITVASGENTKSTNVTITNETGAGSIYVCNQTAITDIQGNSLNTGTIQSAQMNLDNTGPTATLTLEVQNTLAIKATLTNIADDYNSVKTPYYYAISQNATCAGETFTSSTNNPYSFTGLTDAGTYYACVKLYDTLNNENIIINSIDIKAYLMGLSRATYYFKESAYRDKITKIEFVNQIDLTNAISGKEPYILDNYNSGMIKGWLELNDATNNTYDLYIGANTDLIYATNLSGAFYNMQNVSEANLDGLDTSETKNMSSMFSMMAYNPSSFSLDLGNHFDTCNVTHMSELFSNMGHNAKQFSLNLGDKFDTSRTNNMSNMFSMMAYNASSFSLNLGDKFNTSNVTNMAYMFNGMGQIANNYSLNLGDKFDTIKVKDMNMMFDRVGVSAINFNINIGNKFDMSQVSNTSKMFEYFGYRSTAGFTLDLSAGDFNNVTRMSNMFYRFPTSKATILVKDSDAQNWIISQNSGFSATNVLIKGTP